MYSNVKILMKLIIVRQTSSVENQRRLGNMRIINNWIINSVGQNRLNSLMIYSIKSNTIDELHIN